MRRFLEELDRIGFKSVRLEESHSYEGCDYTEHTFETREGVAVDAEMMEHATNLAELMHEGVYEALKKQNAGPQFDEDGGSFGVDVDIQKSLEKGALVMQWDSTGREEIQNECSGDSRIYSWDQFKEIFKKQDEFEVIKSGLEAEPEITLQFQGGGDSGSFHEAETENQRLVDILLKHQEKFLNLVTHDWYNNDGGGATIAFKVEENEIVVSGYGYEYVTEDLETQRGEVEVPFEEPRRPRIRRQGPSAGPSM